MEPLQGDILLLYTTSQGLPDTHILEEQEVLNYRPLNLCYKHGPSLLIMLIITVLSTLQSGFKLMQEPASCLANSVKLQHQAHIVF